MKAIVLLMIMAVSSTNSFAFNTKGLPLICKNADYTKKDLLPDSYLGVDELWKEFDKYYKKHDPRKLAVFIDGTANNKSDSTNIRVLYRMAVYRACQGDAIIPYYDRGVGASKFGLIGKTSGLGISLNIRQAYRFLVETYNTGDDIYLLGFSRGAFTARSLNGFLKFAGLVDRGTIRTSFWPLKLLDEYGTVYDIYDQYRTKHDGTDNFEENLKLNLKAYEKKKLPKINFKDVSVKAIGVFDTVPALGAKKDDEPDRHQIDLYAKKGFHALSLDEQRDTFRLIRFDDLHLQEDQELHEVWFSGVHANIGGSYAKTVGCDLDKKSLSYLDGLEAIPLNWMITKFKDEKLFPIVKLPECAGGKLHDEFFDNAKTYKELGVYRRKPIKGDSIHESVLKRIDITKLEFPHKNREPKGFYKPINVKYPLDKNYAIVP